MTVRVYWRPVAKRQAPRDLGGQIAGGLKEYEDVTLYLGMGNGHGRTAQRGPGEVATIRPGSSFRARLLSEVDPEIWTGG